MKIRRLKVLSMMILFLFFVGCSSAKEHENADTKIKETDFYADLTDEQIQNKVNDVVMQISNWMGYDYYSSENQEVVENLGKEAIPYLLHHIETSGESGKKEEFIIQHIHELLDAKVIIGNWDSGYRVDCEYELYSAQWYARQLISFMNEEDFETRLKNMDSLDIYNKYTDTLLMDKVTHTLEGMSVNHSGRFSFPPKIESNQENYQKISALGIESIPYLARYVEEEVPKSSNLDKRFLREFVVVCLQKMYEEYPLKYTYIQSYSLEGWSARVHEIMFNIKDKDILVE